MNQNFKRPGFFGLLSLGLVGQLAKRSRPTKRNGERGRSGTATVEFAVILPVFVLFTLATIEACSMIYLRQTLEIAAYESCRVALVPRVTSAKVQFAGNQILLDRNVVGGTISINPSNFGGANIQTPITVTVRAPCNSNAVIAPMFFENSTLEASVTMMKEYE